MKMLVLSSAFILAFAAVPALAEGNSPEAQGQSQQMKGPPNADGMKSDSSKMQSGRSDGANDTSMPAGSATGAGKQ